MEPPANASAGITANAPASTTASALWNELGLPPLRPMGVGLAFLYFAIPAAVFSASLLGLLPWMVRSGVAPIWTLTIGFGGPLAMMLLAAFITYGLEGNPWTWPAFRTRMRLGRLSATQWVWTIALAVARPVVATGRADACMRSFFTK
jgi:hypothetical protein